MDGSHIDAKEGGAGTGPLPVNRGKPGSKDHLLCDGNGTPIYVLTDGTNIPDINCAVDLLDCYPPIAGRPGRPRRRFTTLLADKAYSSAARQPGPHGVLKVDRAAMADVLDPQVKFTCPTLLSGTSFAYLTMRTIDESTWEFKAHGYGPNANALTEDLLHLITVWDRQHRDGHGPQIFLYPTASRLPATDAVRLVVPPRQTLTAITWARQRPMTNATEAPTLVVIRGNSGSAKPSIVREVRRYGRGAAPIEQDYLRRVVLREHGSDWTPPSAPPSSPPRSGRPWRRAITSS